MPQLYRRIYDNCFAEVVSLLVIPIQQPDIHQEANPISYRRAVIRDVYAREYQFSRSETQPATKGSAVPEALNVVANSLISSLGFVSSHKTKHSKHKWPTSNAKIRATGAVSDALEARKKITWNSDRHRDCLSR